MTKEKEEIIAPVEETAPATVPQEEYQKLYDQAINLETRYRKLTAAYNNLLELFLSSK